MKKYRFLSLFLAGLTALFLICPALALEDPQPHAGAALVVYGDTGEILYDFNAHQQMYPAYITQVMTALVALDAVDAGEIGLDTEVTVSAWAVTNLPNGCPTVGFKAGEALTVEQLLYCVLLPPGNDACNVLAEAVGGTAAEFVARMNAKAAELGMTDTHFTNPQGLHDPEHYTTAYDIYLMVHAAMENDTFRAIVRTPSYDFTTTRANREPEYTVYSANGFLTGYYVPGQLYSKAIGIKSGGYIAEAGRSLVSAAVDGQGRTFYCVMLDSEYTTDEDGTVHRWPFSDSERLLEWAFDNFRHTVLLNQDTEDVLREVAVTMSDEADYVLVQPVGELTATMPLDYDPKLAKLDFDLPKSVEAPVTAGQKLGTVTLSYLGTVYGTLDMVAMDSVERSEFLDSVKTFHDYWSQWWVKAAVFGGAGLILLVILCAAVLRSRHSSRRYSYSGGGRRNYRSRSNYRGRR